MNTETKVIGPALTPEEWERKAFLEHDGACPKIDGGYLEVDGCSVDGRERHALAALALYEQPFGFTWGMVYALRAGAKLMELHHMSQQAADSAAAADCIAALLPPRVPKI